MSGSYYVEWTIAVPLAGAALETATDAAMDALADLDDQDDVYDLSIGTTLAGEGAVLDICGYVAASSSADAVRRFVDVVLAHAGDALTPVERRVVAQRTPEPTAA